VQQWTLKKHLLWHALLKLEINILCARNVMQKVTESCSQK